MLCERNIEFGIEIYVCFVGYEKAFDRVNWMKLMEFLKLIGLDYRDRRLISNLYLQQEAVIGVRGSESEPAQVGRGVRQGCLLSP